MDPSREGQEATNLVRSHETFTIIEPPKPETRFQKFKREFNIYSLINFFGVILFLFSLFWVIGVEVSNSMLKKQIKSLQAENLLLKNRTFECPEYFRNETGKNAQLEQAADIEYIDMLMEKKREFEEKKKMIEAQDPNDENNMGAGPVEMQSAPDHVDDEEPLDDEDYKDYEEEKMAQAAGNSTVYYDDEAEEEEEDGVVELPTDGAIEIPSGAVNSSKTIPKV